MFMRSVFLTMVLLNGCATHGSAYLASMAVAKIADNVLGTTSQAHASKTTMRTRCYEERNGTVCEYETIMGQNRPSLLSLFEPSAPAAPPSKPAKYATPPPKPVPSYDRGSCFERNKLCTDTTSGCAEFVRRPC